MKDRRWLRKARLYFWVLLFGGYAVAAAGVAIDALDDGYADLSQVASTTVRSSEEARRLGAAQIAAIYRARSGMPFSSLPLGSTLKVIWPDGSSEYILVVSPASGTGTQPIQGTQREAPAPLVLDLSADAAADTKIGKAASDDTTRGPATPRPAD